MERGRQREILREGAFKEWRVREPLKTARRAQVCENVIPERDV